MTRIHAYAFRDCLALKEIECGDRQFRYVYDTTSEPDKTGIVFGTEAFHNTPWSQTKWNGFYIRDDCLYIAFPGNETDLVIPKDVRVLKTFSLNHLALASVILPDTLTHIENFTFSGSVINEPVTMPDSVTELDDYALADCSILWEPNDLLTEKAKTWKKQNKADGRMRFPMPFKQYSLVLSSRKAYGKFKKLRIRENHIKEDSDGAFRSYILDDWVDVTQSVLRRIVTCSRHLASLKWGLLTQCA